MPKPPEKQAYLGKGKNSPHYATLGFAKSSIRAKMCTFFHNIAKEFFHSQFDFEAIFKSLFVLSHHWRQGFLEWIRPVCVRVRFSFWWEKDKREFEITSFSWGPNFKAFYSSLKKRGEERKNHFVQKLFLFILGNIFCTIILGSPLWKVPIRKGITFRNNKQLNDLLHSALSMNVPLPLNKCLLCLLLLVLPFKK